MTPHKWCLFEVMTNVGNVNLNRVLSVSEPLELFCEEGKQGGGGDARQQNGQTVGFE